VSNRSAKKRKRGWGIRESGLTGDHPGNWDLQGKNWRTPATNLDLTVTTNAEKTEKLCEKRISL